MVYLDDLVHFLDEFMEAGDHVAGIDPYGVVPRGRREIPKNHGIVGLLG